MPVPRCRAGCQPPFPRQFDKLVGEDFTSRESTYRLSSPRERELTNAFTPCLPAAPLPPPRLLFLCANRCLARKAFLHRGFRPRPCSISGTNENLEEYTPPLPPEKKYTFVNSQLTRCMAFGNPPDCQTRQLRNNKFNFLWNAHIPLLPLIAIGNVYFGETQIYKTSKNNSCFFFSLSPFANTRILVLK